jgi:molybdate transport system ATP-binding protein
VKLALAVRHRLDDFRLDVAFDTDAEVVALFGPSGAGKSSLVHLIAGIERPQAGRIAIDGRCVVDRAAGVFVPTHRRRVGCVFQDARLFPHLAVADNLRYGLERTPAADRRFDLDDVVQRLGLAPLLGRMPARLSGGEKQRVALGRALLASPTLLLLDEPLAALDDEARAEILGHLEHCRRHWRLPMVYVSHNRAEVARLAEVVVRIADGRVAELTTADAFAAAR